MNKCKEIEQLKQLTSDALAFSKKMGASAAEVNCGLEDGFSLDVRLGNLETLTYHRDRGIDITVYFGQRQASVSITDIDPISVQAAVKRACKIAQFTEEDPYIGLADAALMATHIPDLDLFHRWDITPKDAAELASTCEQQARDLDERIVNSEGVGISSHQTYRVYGNTHGFIAGFPSTLHSICCGLVAQDGSQMERDYSFSVARAASQLKDIEVIAKQSVERTVAHLGSRQLSTRKVPAILDARIARGLFHVFVSAISGGNLYRKNTFLLDQLEQPVFSKFVRIYEDPFLPKHLGSSPFDTEGVATQKKDFVQEGVLKSYILSSYSARKLGMQSTGNAGGVYNLLIEPGQQSLKDLLKTMDTGLYITDLVGQGVHLVTGDFSQGAVGFWVEKGEIQFPVSEVTCSANLKDVFLNLVAVGNDIDLNSSIKTGSVLLEELTIAGQNES